LDMRFKMNAGSLGFAVAPYCNIINNI